jgi:hypothetical protein
MKAAAAELSVEEPVEAGKAKKRKPRGKKAAEAVAAAEAEAEAATEAAAAEPEPALPQQPQVLVPVVTPERFAELEAEAASMGYGKLYAAFGGGPVGLEACAGVEALCEVGAIDKLLSAFIVPLQVGAGGCRMPCLLPS